LAKATSRSATIDWGTPDPRDAAAYPSVAGTPPTHWAWEFLRRRDDYRRRWQQLNREQGHHAILGNHGTVRSICSCVTAQHYAHCGSELINDYESTENDRP
jgi:hypothetical protein